MSVANSKRSVSSSRSREMALAGALVRAHRRRGGSLRVGRRSALLGALTSLHANSSRRNGFGPSTNKSEPSRNGQA